MINRLRGALQRDGLSFLLIRIIAKILNVDIGVQHAKTKAWNILEKRYNHTIAYGPFKGMSLSEDVWWSKNDRITQTLGVYEEHVLDKLIYFSSQGSKRFIDIGAADGYFAIGMAFSKKYTDVHIFEIEPRGRERIRENAALNLCTDMINVYGEANFYSLKNLINKKFKSTILIDIEGAEYDLLNNEVLSLLAGNYCICELHPWLVSNGYKLQNDLLDRASKLFNVELMFRASYAPNLFPEFDDLSDEERLIAVGEGRDKNMQWLVLTPK